MTREEFLAGVEQQPSGRFERIDSGTRDRATKLRAYFKLPSLRHHLIVWPDEQRIVRHSRGPDDQPGTQVFISGEIRHDRPGLMVTVEEFYVD